MKKTYQRLPESELDIMLVLWNGTPPMTRPEIEKVINIRKNLAPTTILSLLFCRSDQAGKNESIYAVDFTDRLSGT